MVGRNRARRRRLGVVTIIGVTLGMVVLSGPSGADVTAVQGSAYGYQANVSLFSGPSTVRGVGQVACTTNNPPTPPGCIPTTQLATNPLSASESPSVVLPAAGGNVTQTDPNGAAARYGPATIFGGIWPENMASAPPSGPITVGCNGTTGPGGSVTCNSAITLFSPAATPPGGIGPGPVVADEARSTCSATEINPATGAKSLTGSASFVNGILETSYHPQTQLPRQTEPIPANPPPNYTREGAIEHVGDTYRVIFNEQITNPDGSLTVNAVHLILLGPTAVGDLIIGSVTCGLTTVGVPTTLTPTTQTPTTQTPTTQTPTTQTPTTQTPTTQTPTTQTPTTQTPTTQTPTTQTPTTQTPTTQTPTTQTPTTVVTTTTTTTPPFGGGLAELIRQIVCPILRALATSPFIGQFIQPFLSAFGCTA